MSHELVVVTTRSPSGRSARRSEIAGAARLLAVIGLAVALGLALHHGRLDQALFHLFNQTQPAAPLLWDALSQLGLGASSLLLVAALCARQPERLAACIVAMLSAGIVVQAFKHGLPMPRPLAVLGPENVLVLGEALWGRALPSGHTASAFALAGALLADASPTRAWRLRALALGFAIAVGWSRMAVGAHWPTDVLAGAVVGLALGRASWGLGSTHRIARLLARPRPRRCFAGLWLLLAATLAFDAVADAASALWLAVAAGLVAAWRCWQPLVPPPQPVMLALPAPVLPEAQPEPQPVPQLLLPPP